MTAASYLIGVDLGTSVIKTTLVSLDGERVADMTLEASLVHPRPGWAEQDANEFYQAALRTIQGVVEQVGVGPADVAAIAFDGQCSGAMGINAQGEAITPWYPSALDIRYQPYLAQMEASAGERLLQVNGASPFAAPRMLWWRSEAPGLWRRIAKVVILGNYVASRMAGLKADDAFISPSYLGWYGLCDTAKHAWSDELIELFDIPRCKLPRIVPSTEIIGRLSPEAARVCGLAAGVPLVAGAGDQAAGFLGAGVVEAGQLIDVAGTFSVLGACLERFLADTRYKMFNAMATPLPDENWYALMFISGGGLTHRWYRDQFGTKERARAAPDATAAYHSLDVQASEVPAGSDGLVFIPHLGGRSCPVDPDVRGAWLGFTWTHQKPHFYRALLESIAYDYAEALAVVKDHFPDFVFSEVRVIGGGAASNLWNQIKADVLGVPYVRVEREDVAALGCAIMGGHAVGLYPDMAATARQFARPGERIEPSPMRHRLYADYAKTYRCAFDQLRGLYEGLAPLANRNLDASSD